MMQLIIVGAAVAGAVVCLVVYAALSLAPVRAAIEAHKEAKKAKEAREARADAPTRQNITVDPDKLAEALAKLVEALAKAGPAFWSMFGAMLFLLIALQAAGLLH